MARLTTWVSPYTSVPRLLPWARLSRARQRIATVAIFALIPTVLFWWWYATAVVDRIDTQPSTLIWAIPTAALWVTISPLLMQQAEFNLEDVLEVFGRHGQDAGWNIEAMQAAVRRWDRAFYVVVIPVGLAPMVALALSFEPLDAYIPVQSVINRIAGLIVIGAVGVCSAAGIWGISKVLALISEATRGAMLRWTAFRAQRAWGIGQLYSFAWVRGLFFSCGGLFAPAMLGVLPELTLGSRIIVEVFLVLLLLGGVTVFSIPVWQLHQVSLQSQERALEDATETVKDPGRVSTEIVQRDLTRLDLALRLRTVIAATDPAPFSFGFVGRAATTLLLPIALTMIQILGSG